MNRHDDEVYRNDDAMARTAPEPSDEPLPRPPSPMEVRHHGPVATNWKEVKRKSADTPERRARTAARQQAMRDAMALGEIREKRELTQTDVAKVMEISQGRREAWLAAHGGDRIPCVGCSGEGVVPYGDPQYPSRTVWRCVECAEREAAIRARTADESAEQAEDVRLAAAVVLADLLDRADALEGETDRTSVRSLRMMATAMSVLEVEYDLDEAVEPVVSLRARAQDGQAAPPATSDTPRELREPYTAADAPRACDVCGSPVPDGETCGECGRTFPRGADVVGLPYAPLVEDGNDGHDLERRVCPVCLDVTLDYAAHWREAGHVELTEADGPFLTESREQSTAAAFRIARGEQPPAGEWIA